GLALDAMVQDFERATGPWDIEWSAIPESFVLTSGSLRQAKFMLAGLEVDTERMRRNLDVTQGLIVAESVMMGLAPHLGRQTAHDISYETCRTASNSGSTLAQTLGDCAKVTAHLDMAAIEMLCDPSHYLGAASLMVDQMRQYR